MVAGESLTNDGALLRLEPALSMDSRSMEAEKLLGEGILGKQKPPLDPFGLPLALLSVSAPAL